MAARYRYPPDVRVGIGYDIHAFDASRTLVLGGIKVPGSWGLRGHSDADVLLHAIVDAMLGAAGLGDLGDHFPDTDPEWEGIPSALLVAEALAKVRAKGWVLGNVDATVIAERPKLSPYRAAIEERVAALLELDPSAVNVKATTNEALGAVGRGEGMAAMAVVLLQAAPND